MNNTHIPDLLSLLQVPPSPPPPHFFCRHPPYYQGQTDLPPCCRLHPMPQRHDPGTHAHAGNSLIPVQSGNRNMKQLYVYEEKFQWLHILPCRFSLCCPHNVTGYHRSVSCTVEHVLLVAGDQTSLVFCETVHDFCGSSSVRQAYICNRVHMYYYW